MIDWNHPIEHAPPGADELVARERIESSKMTWVQIVGGEEDWDGWWCGDDGLPRHDGDKWRAPVRNKAGPDQTATS